MIQLEVDAKSEYVVTTAEDGKIRVWDPKKYKLVKNFKHFYTP